MTFIVAVVIAVSQQVLRNNTGTAASILGRIAAIINAHMIWKIAYVVLNYQLDDVPDGMKPEITF